MLLFAKYPLTERYIHGLFFMYHSLEYVVFSSFFTLYGYVGWCIKGSVVHRNCQQCLVTEWLGLSVSVSIRAVSNSTWRMCLPESLSHDLTLSSLLQVNLLMSELEFDDSPTAQREYNRLFWQANIVKPCTQYAVAMDTHGACDLLSISAGTCSLSLYFMEFQHINLCGLPNR